MELVQVEVRAPRHVRVDDQRLIVHQVAVDRVADFALSVSPATIRASSWCLTPSMTW